MGVKMSYSCPTGCGYEGGLTAMMNHLRLKQDNKHTEMYQKFKQKTGDNVDNVDNVDDDNNDNEDIEETERPDLEDSFNESMKSGDDMEVKELDSGVEKETENPEYVGIDNVEFDKLVSNGVADDHTECKNLLVAAKKQGYSKINPKNGDLK